MRTSFHHQPEAQHPNFQLSQAGAALADPKMKARLADLGGTALLGLPVDFGKLIAEETEKWGKVVKFSGAKAD